RGRPYIRTRRLLKPAQCRRYDGRHLASIAYACAQRRLHRRPKGSGRRAVYTYSPGLGPANRYPKDLLRLQSQYFSSSDQLLTLELNAAPNPDNWALARQARVPIICHIVGDRSGNFEAIGRAVGDQRRRTWPRIATRNRRAIRYHPIPL